MNLKLFMLYFTVALLPCSSLAQEMNNKILMSVNGIKVQSGEFIRMYNKTKAEGQMPDPENYLEQFIIFKLKVADAMNEGLDTTSAFKKELSGYRKQLAQSYLTDNKKKEEILREAYKRMQSEINAWHILIAMPQDPSPEDTLEAWNKAIDVRERILKGEQFEQVARSASDDQSVKINGGNLGYFTAFQMIMPFEDGAYSLKKGEISLPVRTPYGYHIIKVADKRPSKGKVRVAHIMKVVPPGANPAVSEKADADIKAIFRELKEGASFSELARKYSDHKESAQMGGALEWFGTGEIIPEFSEASLSIQDTGVFTSPVRTPYGWHIIKLLEKKNIGSFEDSKAFIETRINQSYLNSVCQQELVSKLKKEYRFRIDEDTYSWFLKNTDTLVIQGLKKYNYDSIPSGNIYTFASKALTAKEFAKYIEKRGQMVVTKDSVRFIDQSLESKLTDQIISYENSVLEKKYPEFRYLMNEFHDGILLFEISGKRVWNRVNNDSAGLMNYYREYSSSHLTPEGIKAKIYTIREAGKQDVLFSAYKKYSAKQDPDQQLRKKFNKKGRENLYITDSTWYYGSDSEIDKVTRTAGLHSFTWKGYPSIIVIKERIEPVPLPYNEVQEEVVAAYQEKLEKDWIKQLKEKYTVKVDNNEFLNVKKKLINE